MDDVFQLANIPRPAVGLELVLGFWADPYLTMPQPLAVDLYEVPGQGRMSPGRSRSGSIPD